ncbi:MAG: hypothetical protein IIX67_03500 [Clostridia bacterium]|nr:hypothetical protein [Clostridia bacterium]
MHIYKSRYSEEELINRWDDFTSPARFAGADDVMDLIYVSKRKGKKVRLVRRARTKREPFSCVFYGTIESTEQGSQIKGSFMKSLIDYIAVALIVALLFYIRFLVIERGDSPVTVNVLLGASIVFGILLLYNTRSIKRKFSEFISRITDAENDKFLSKKDLKNKEN